MLITKFVEVKMGGHSIKHYKSLGYDVKYNSIITIPIKHLTEGSHTVVEVECDYCGKHVFKTYQKYLSQRRIIDKDCCNDKKCKATKFQESCLEKYGVNTYAKTKECQEKYKKTCLEKYGVENYSKTEEFKEFMKIQWKNLTEEERNILTDKRKQANLELYGVDWYCVTDEFKNKSKETCLERYGVEYPQLSLEIRKKSMESYLKNGTMPTSQQQIKLFEMTQSLFNDNVFLNYPFDYYCLDIALILDEMRINIEYDGWYWHQDEERDRKRNDYIINNYWKVLRIKSGIKLPTIEQLKKSLNILINTDETYQEIILDDWKENDSEIAI